MGVTIQTLQFPSNSPGGERMLLIRALGKLASFSWHWHVKWNPLAISALSPGAKVGNIYLLVFIQILSDVCHRPQLCNMLPGKSLWIAKWDTHRARIPRMIESSKGEAHHTPTKGGCPNSCLTFVENKSSDWKVLSTVTSPQQAILKY